FVVARPADVVEVIVDTGTAPALTLRRRRQPSQVAPVVITPEQGHVVRHAHAPLVVLLYFLVEGPDLRHVGGRTPRYGGQDIALVRHDFLEQGDVRLFRHSLIAVSAHTDGEERLVVLHPLDAAAPELPQPRLILRVVPRSLTVTSPLVMRTRQGLVVRSAHDDAVLVGKRRILRIVI